MHTKIFYFGQSILCIFLSPLFLRRVTLDATNITRAELQVQLDIPGLQSVTRMVSVAARGQLTPHPGYVTSLIGFLNH